MMMTTKMMVQHFSILSHTFVRVYVYVCDGASSLVLVSE